MSITSPEFALFTMGVLFVFHLLPLRWRSRWLLIMSYVFLVILDVEFALIFAVLTVMNYLASHHVTPQSSHRYAVLRLGIALNVFALVYFKYAHFFLDKLELTNGLRILFPIGLSFYILQAISYLLDISQGLLNPTTDKTNFALYMVYFPRLISGPIERARDFLPRLQSEVKSDVIPRSLTLIGVGLVRKIVVADTLNLLIPDKIFSMPREFHGTELAIWLLAYAFLLYNDFEGYTSLVRGVSLLFGIELSKNFNTPYFSRNFTEFWQKWHISLSSWLRDYIFTPTLRGLLRRKYNGRHPLTLIAPPMLTMVMSALWHDISAGMLLWGILHGIFQVIERLRSLWKPVRPPHLYPIWRQLLSMVLVFMLVILAWIPFRMPLATAFDYALGIFNPLNWDAIDITQTGYLIFLLALILSLILDSLQLSFGEEIYFRLSPLGKAVAINLAIVLLVLALALQGNTPPPFIYQQF